MTTISIAIATTSSLLGDIVEASSPQEAAVKFIGNLELDEGEFIVSIICASLEHDYPFENEVEALFYQGVPEWFHPDYAWVESV